MNKKLYIQPDFAVDELKIDDAFMLTASEEDTIIDDGGTTSGSGVTEGDAKNRNEWNDGLW